MIRVLLAAPSPALRAGLRHLLAADERLTVVGEAARLADLGEQAGNSDVILAAVEIASLRSGLEEALPGAEVFPALLWVCEDLGSAAQGVSELARLPLAAWGVLSPDASGEELAAAVRALAEGLIAAEPRMLPTFQAFNAQTTPESAPLTPRETEVLQFLAQGLANKQIAHQLGISEHTVKFHVSAIYAKLKVGNRTEAVRAGARQGLIVL